MESGKFDAIVVGAGPAGCAAAYSLAKAGLNVLVIERGKFPGAKNVFGGMLCGSVLAELIPNFWEEAPLERYITRHVVTFLSEKDSFSIDFQTPDFGKPPYNGYSILRAKFDKWLAQQVEQAGAIIVPNLLVDDLLWDGKQVIGVKAGGEVFPANVVIDAEGVNSMLAQKAGLAKELSAEYVSLGVKELIRLPQEVIEERFNLEGDEGVTQLFDGFCTKGMHGGGFLYTNKESLSLGLVVQLSALRKRRVKLDNLLEEFKSHPSIRKLIKGGTLEEYSAHLVPNAGIKMMSKLYGNGFLVVGDAGGLVLTTGITLDGVSFAFASGIAAAEAVKLAKQAGDFSQETLCNYEKFLKESFVLQDLETFKHSQFFLNNPRLYTTYPNLACNLAKSFFTNDGKARKRLWTLARNEMEKQKLSMLHLAMDALLGKRAI